jgi:uncharacterized OsmC-like protein
MRFSRLDLHVPVTVAEDTSEELVRSVLDKAKRCCLIANSLNADVHVNAAIDARTIETDGVTT